MKIQVKKAMTKKRIKGRKNPEKREKTKDKKEKKK